jgi:hypothetical protein
METPFAADLLSDVIRLASDGNEVAADEIRAVLSKAFSDPGFEARLRAVLETEGVSAELQREYLRIFAEWRRAATPYRRSSS